MCDTRMKRQNSYFSTAIFLQYIFVQMEQLDCDYEKKPILWPRYMCIQLFAYFSISQSNIMLCSTILQGSYSGQISFKLKWMHLGITLDQNYKNQSSTYLKIRLGLRLL